MSKLVYNYWTNVDYISSLEMLVSNNSQRQKVIDRWRAYTRVREPEIEQSA